MHPLDPLSADEITAAAHILRREQQLTDRWRFASIELREPSKETVKAFTAGGAITREAIVIGWDRDDGAVYKARDREVEQIVVARREGAGVSRVLATGRVLEKGTGSLFTLFVKSDPVPFSRSRRLFYRQGAGQPPGIHSGRQLESASQRMGSSIALIAAVMCAKSIRRISSLGW